jgi:hypothetical protein
MHSRAWGPRARWQLHGQLARWQALQPAAAAAVRPQGEEELAEIGDVLPGLVLANLLEDKVKLGQGVAYVPLPGLKRLRAELAPLHELLAAGASGAPGRAVHLVSREERGAAEELAAVLRWAGCAGAGDRSGQGSWRAGPIWGGGGGRHLPGTATRWPQPGAVKDVWTEVLGGAPASDSQEPLHECLSACSAAFSPAAGAT